MRIFHEFPEAREVRDRDSRFWKQFSLGITCRAKPQQS